MSKYIPTDLRAAIQKKLEKIERFKKILPDDEIKQKIDAFYKHYKNPENKYKTFNDKARDWIFIQSPKPELGEELDDNGNPIPMNLATPQDSQFSNKKQYRWRCVFKLGEITLWLSEEQYAKIGWNNLVIVLGRLKKQFTIPSTTGWFDTLKDVAEALNVPSVADLTEEEDYNRDYSMGVWQVIV